MLNYIKLMRVHHYIKNTLVFVALICSAQLFDPEKLTNNFIAFIAFCMISSAVYIFNDIKDREKDKKHPSKCNRPIAAGGVPVRNACLMMVILYLIAMFCNSLIYQAESTVLLVVYFTINLAYSMGLKNIPIVDVSILAAGFLIRIMYGAFVTDIVISNWLYLTVITMSFYFAFGKRRNELKHTQDGETRIVLKSYPINFLDKNMYMCLTLANVFYTLWCMDENTILFYDSSYLIFTVPIVLLITMKYSLDVEGDSDGDPVEVLLHDKSLIFLCIVYFAIMCIILYS